MGHLKNEYVVLRSAMLFFYLPNVKSVTEKLGLKREKERNTKKVSSIITFQKGFGRRMLSSLG